MTAIVIAKNIEALNSHIENISKHGKCEALYMAILQTSYGVDDYDFEVKMVETAYMCRNTGLWVVDGVHVQRNQVYRRLSASEIAALADWYSQLP